MTSTTSTVTSRPTRTTFSPGRNEKRNMAAGLLGWEPPPGGGARASPRRRRLPAIDEREARKRDLRNGRAVLEEQVGHLGGAIVVLGNVGPDLHPQLATLRERPPLPAVSGRPDEIHPKVDDHLNEVIHGALPAGGPVNLGSANNGAGYEGGPPVTLRLSNQGKTRRRC